MEIVCSVSGCVLTYFDILCIHSIDCTLPKCLCARACVRLAGVYWTRSQCDDFNWWLANYIWNQLMFLKPGRPCFDYRERVCVAEGVCARVYVKVSMRVCVCVCVCVSEWVPRPAEISQQNNPIIIYQETKDVMVLWLPSLLPFLPSPPLPQGLNIQPVFIFRTLCQQLHFESHMAENLAAFLLYIYIIQCTALQLVYVFGWGECQ